ncbi:MAG: hypothetical protein QOF56_3930 [Acidobacteriaceae bacterium]|nr:hypothetical protein [Acidobacteriaceae bacterium]
MPGQAWGHLFHEEAIFARALMKKSRPELNAALRGAAHSTVVLLWVLHYQNTTAGWTM